MRIFVVPSMVSPFTVGLFRFEIDLAWPIRGTFKKAVNLFCSTYFSLILLLTPWPSDLFFCTSLFGNLLSDQSRSCLLDRSYYLDWFGHLFFCLCQISEAIGSASNKLWLVKLCLSISNNWTDVPTSLTFSSYSSLSRCSLWCCSRLNECFLCFLSRAAFSF